MSDVTQILSQIESGDASSAEQLLPLVYDELRRLAAQKLAHENPGQTLQATALVHEAFLRLAGGGANIKWNSRGHFFAAAAEAMRRILVENARRKKSQKRGGDLCRVELDHLTIEATQRPEKLIALNDALTSLQEKDPQKAALIKLRFFAGLTNQEAAAALGISAATADRYWTYARAWVQREMQKSSE